MIGLDPEAETSPAGPEDTQSTDQSKSGLRKAWDAWTSRPENNAALMQFGIAMMQPRAPGQSGIGAFGNAIGQGAEASDRNIAAQRAETDAAANRSFKEREAGARETTAKAYADQVAQGGGKGKPPGLQAQLATQKSFNAWLSKPEDALGLTSDPIVGAISKQFPEIKTKADLLSHPAAMQAARKLFTSQLAEPDEEGGGAVVPPPQATTQPANPAGSQANILQQAKDAIARGADRGAVIQRLQSMGVSTTGL